MENLEKGKEEYAAEALCKNELSSAKSNRATTDHPHSDAGIVDIYIEHRVLRLR
jgi:hypothetical protein